MTLTRWQQIENLYFEVLELSPTEQADFLRGATGDDELRREVETLLAAQDLTDDFLPETELFALGCEAIVERGRALHRGQTFGDYRISGFLGSGGMGEVYLAEDLRENRRVALKILPSAFGQDAERIRRFRREARAASRIVHENVARIYEVGTAENLDYIALEYVAGKTLRRYLNDTNPTVAEILPLAEQIVAALEAAHDCGIVHRDLKPENVMVTPDGTIKVLDFSIAKFNKKSLLPIDSRQTVFDSRETAGMEISGKIVGTTGYMSPEQLRGGEIDSRTDIWSFGVLLYEVLTGKLPFHGATNVDLIAAILTSEPIFPAAVSNDFRQIINKSLRKNPAERYQTAGELSDALKNLSKQSAMVNKKRMPHTILAVVVAFALFGAIGIWLIKLYQSAALFESTKQTACTDTNGLLSWYAAEDNADDRFNRNNGTLENGVTFADGKFGQGFRFDGEDDFVRSSTRDFPIENQDRTIEAWVKVEKFWDGLYTETFFFGYGNFNNTPSLIFVLGLFDYNRNKNNLFFSQWGSSIAGESLEIGTFYHVAATNTGDKVSLYLNGKLMETKTLPLNIGADAELFIGRIGNKLGDYRRLNGIVDEVKIYNRALTADEIKFIYNDGKGIDCR